MSSSGAYFQEQLSSAGYENVSLPAYASDPLTSLSNLSLEPPQFRRPNKKKSRMSSIEKRFGMDTKQKKKRTTRSMDQLMIDLTPKWQRPAVEEHYRAGRGRSEQTTTSNKKKVSSGVRRQRQQQQRQVDKQTSEKRRQVQQRVQNAEATVAEKYTALKPGWRSVAALEDDDGSTKSAIASLLHSGFRLQVPGEGVPESHVSEPTSEAYQQQNEPGGSSWKPQFISASVGEQTRKAAAVAKLREMVGGERGSEHRDADGDGDRDKARGRNENRGRNEDRDRDNAGNKRGRNSRRGKHEGVRHRGRETSRDRGRDRDRTNRSEIKKISSKSRGNRRVSGRSDRSGRQRSNNTNINRDQSKNPYANSRRSRSTTQPIRKKKRPVWGGGSSSKSNKSNKSSKGKASSLRKRGDNSFHPSASNLSITSTSSTTKLTRRRHPLSTSKSKRRTQRSTSQPPKRKQQRRGLQSSVSTNSLSSSSRRRINGQQNRRSSRADEYSTPVLTNRTMKKGSRSSTFLTSLASEDGDLSQSPMRGRIRAKRTGREGIRGIRGNGGNKGNKGNRASGRDDESALNTSRGLGGHDRELHGVRTRTKRSVRSAPVATMSSLRLSPDSKRKRVAWMQKPVLNRRSNGRNRNRTQTIHATVGTQRSRNQLSKMTSRSQRQRQERQQQTRQQRQRQRQQSGRREDDIGDDVDVDESTMSSTFLTGSVMLNSPPKDTRKGNWFSDMDNENDENNENKNDEQLNLSSTFLTSSHFSPESPRLSKRVHGNRKIPRAQREHLVKRSLGKSLW